MGLLQLIGLKRKTPVSAEVLEQEALDAYRLIENIKSTGSISDAVFNFCEFHKLVESSPQKEIYDTEVYEELLGPKFFEAVLKNSPNSVSPSVSNGTPTLEKAIENEIFTYQEILGNFDKELMVTYAKRAAYSYLLMKLAEIVAENHRMEINFDKLLNDYDKIRYLYQQCKGEIPPTLEVKSNGQAHALTTHRIVYGAAVNFYLGQIKINSASGSSLYKALNAFYELEPSCKEQEKFARNISALKETKEGRDAINKTQDLFHESLTEACQHLEETKARNTLSRLVKFTELFPDILDETGEEIAREGEALMERYFSNA